MFQFQLNACQPSLRTSVLVLAPLWTRLLCHMSAQCPESKIYCILSPLYHLEPLSVFLSVIRACVCVCVCVSLSLSLSLPPPPIPPPIPPSPSPPLPSPVWFCLFSFSSLYVSLCLYLSVSVFLSLSMCYSLSTFLSLPAYLTAVLCHRLLLVHLKCFCFLSLCSFSLLVLCMYETMCLHGKCIRPQNSYNRYSCWSIWISYGYMKWVMSSQPSYVSKTLTLDITRKLFNQFFSDVPYVQAPLISTILYHFH